MGSPCGWVVDDCPCGDTTWDALDAGVRDRAEAQAALVMWAATGRQFGACEVTVMPCGPRPSAPLYQTFPVALSRGVHSPWGEGDDSGRPVPTIDGGTWFNRCGAGCSCSADCEVRLDGPVIDIVEVRVDGALVDTGAYRVLDRSLLVRTDGECWPSCQHMGDEVPGFTVTYDRGTLIPPAVQAAFEQLACEYAKACVGAPCGLPPRVTNLTRQGVSVTVEQVTDTDPNGVIRTGIKAVDDVIKAVNPYGLTERPQVFSPDLPTNRVITWP